MLSLVLACAAGIVVLDQLTKAWALAALSPGEPVEVLGEFLRLNLTFNSGAAFGLAQGQTAVISLVAIGVAGAIVKLSSQLVSKRWAVALAAMLGGAVGNLLDRVFREPGALRGEVVDFLQLPMWPVFNVADMAVVAGAVGVVVLTLLGVPHRAEDREAAT